MNWILRVFLVIAVLGLLGGFFAMHKKAFHKPKAADTGKIPPGAADWPFFRGDPELTGTSTANLPNRPKLIWTFKAGEAVESSPVIAGGRVIFGCSDGNVYALRLRDGKLLWKFASGCAVEAPPLVVGDKIFIGNLAGDFFQLSLDNGAVGWKYSCGKQIYGSANFFKTGDGRQTVIFGAYDFQVHCLDVTDGKQLWSAPTKNFINGAVAVSARQQVAVFGGCDAELRIIDLKNGKETNAVHLKSYIPGSPAIRDGVAYVGDYAKELCAVNLADGKILWSYGDSRNGAEFSAPPAVTEEQVIIGDHAGTLHFIDRKTGKKLGYFRTAGEIDAGAVICGHDVVVADKSGMLYIINLDTATEKWKYETGIPISASPAVVEGRIIIADTDGNIYQFANPEAAPAVIKK